MFIKGFDKNLRCRGMQFEIGKTYDTGYTENLELCSCKVFHFCKSLENVHEFYSAKVENNNRFCEIEVLGELVEDERKCGSNKIKILREITGEELAIVRENLIEEIADVMICLEQLKVIFHINEEELNCWIEAKENRLITREGLKE